MLGVRFVKFNLFIALCGCMTDTATNIDSRNDTVRQTSVHIEAPERVSYKPYARIADPTGTAPTSRVERFELRNGDCLGNDCIPKNQSGQIVTRGRVERIVDVDLRDGDTGIYEYHVYFPSAEFNSIRPMSTNFGQLWARSTPDYNSRGSDFFSLDKEDHSDRITIKLKNVNQSEVRRTIGVLGSAEFPYDTWMKVRVEFRLSSQPDGYARAYLNDRLVSQLRDVTFWPSGVLSYRYGIYQNYFPSSLGPYSSKSEFPPQVVYFSGIGIRRGVVN